MELGLFFQIAGRRIQLNCSYKGSVLRIDHSCAEVNRGALERPLLPAGQSWFWFGWGLSWKGAGQGKG